MIPSSFLERDLVITSIRWIIFVVSSSVNRTVNELQFRLSVKVRYRKNWGLVVGNYENRETGEKSKRGKEGPMKKSNFYRGERSRVEFY